MHLRLSSCVKGSFLSVLSASFLVCVSGLPVRAETYEVSIEIEDEQDIRELGDQGLISATTLETLLELFEEGVDLNTANRDELYELPELTYAEVDGILEYRKLSDIKDPADLVPAGVLSEEKLLRIAPFLILSQGSRRPVTGRVRAMSHYGLADDIAPSSCVHARSKGPYGLRAAALLVTTRRRMGEMRLDPDRIYEGRQGQLVADTPGYQVHLTGGERGKPRRSLGNGADFDLLYGRSASPVVLIGFELQVRTLHPFH